MRFNKVTWSIAEVYYLEKHKTLPVSQLTIALSKSKAAVSKKLKEIEGGKVSSSIPTKNKVSFIGKRPDCDNLFFRSGWEADVYRWMRLQKKRGLSICPGRIPVRIEYEPTTFSFAPFGVLKGTVSYTPDFKVTFTDGSYYWIEIKGQLKRVDGTKIRRFKKYYPEEFKKLAYITGSDKTKAGNFFRTVGAVHGWAFNELKKEWRDKIPGWETR